MKTIIAATDFSKCGNHAVEYAAFLAEELNSRLIICHVSKASKEGSRLIGRKSECEIIPEKLSIIQREISQSHENLRLECKVLAGSRPAEMIQQYSLECQADLIIVGSAVINLLKDKLIGRTSSKLLEFTNVPVLCIPAKSNYCSIRTIAFATDIEEDNLNAAISIVTFAKHFNAEILFLFVDDNDIVKSDEQASRLARKIREKVRYPRISGYIIHDNNLKNGIFIFQDKYHADLLVMLKREHGDLKQIRNRSNSVYISEHLTFPLLVLKPGVVSVI